MSNLLVNYLNKRLDDDDLANKSVVKQAGPVITFSREVGCNGVKLARILADRLNTESPLTKWKVISKEVFYESARELKMDPTQLQKNIKQSEKFVFEEILKAFSDKNYKNQKKIGNTIKKVIRQIATDGNCIIVGRAGHIIAAHIKDALHIRLIAPLEYRIHTIMENDGLSREKAIEFIDRVEKERISFRKSVLGSHSHEDLFDITMNRASFSNQDIIDLIVFAAKVKAIHK